MQAALGQTLEGLDQDVLNEIPPPSDTAPLGKLLAKATPTVAGVRAAKPATTLPTEWKDFTPTSTQNPSALFVGTLLAKDPAGKFVISSDAILLVNKECKPPMTIDSKEDKVYTYATKVQAGATLNLGIVTLKFGHNEAVSLTLSRVGTVAPTSGIDGKAVETVKQKVDVEHNKHKYWICTAQELFLTTYQKLQGDKGGGTGTYDVVKIDGTYFREMSELKKLYNFRLQLVPLEAWVSQ